MLNPVDNRGTYIFDLALASSLPATANTLTVAVLGPIEPAVGLSIAENVECVQQALLQAGFDPNGVDGMVGGGTRRAAMAWRTENNAELLPELDIESSTLWCSVLTSAV
jgi:peptidoglycan hydrolase-like protein with peptidoglycan-binding domain